MLLYALGCLPLAFVLYGSSIYLARGLGLPQATIGKLLWIPPLGWELGYFFWGWVVDRRGLRKGLFSLLAVLSLPLMAVSHVTALPVAMGLMFFAMFIAAGYVIGVVAYGTTTFSGAHAGFLAGLSAGSWSAAVALTMPVFGRLFDQQRYHEAFFLAAVIPVLGWVTWRVLTKHP